MMSTDSILFQNLHISFSHVGRSVSVFGFEIAYYGIVIGIGMLLAGAFILYDAKRKGQSTDNYMDVFIWAIVCGIIGARIYYVIFSWDEYRDNPISVFFLRQGGLAIYGGIIGGVFGIWLTCRVKKMGFLDVLDTACLGVLIGQILGRWGNFFNREVFGRYDDGLLSMQIPVDAVRDSSDITAEMLSHAITIDGVTFISVHPTFLYESLWNLGVFLLLLFLRKRKLFDGEIWFLYLAWYGLGRFWIEGMRTDRLMIQKTDIPVSQFLSAILVIGSVIFLWISFIKYKKRGQGDKTNVK